MAGMFLYWGCLDTSHIFMPNTFVHLRGADTLICPPYSSVHLYVLRGFCMLWGGCRGPFHGGHLPYMLDTSPCMGVPPHVLHPHSLVGFPVHLCFGDICMCYGEYSPYVGDLGVFPHMLGVLGPSAALDVYMLHLLPSCSSLCLMYLPWL